MNRQRYITAIAIASSALVLFLSAAAFALSYSALRALAGDNGIPAQLTWLWPLTVDGFILAAALAILRGALLGEDTRWQWVLLAAFTIASIAFNIAHAPGTPLSQTIAATPPLALFLALEILARQLRHNIERSGATDANAALGLAPAATTALTLAPDVAAAPPVTSTPASLDARDAIVAFYSSHPLATQAQAAQAVALSRQRVGQMLASLEAAGAIKRNGHGVEILEAR